MSSPSLCEIIEIVDDLSPLSSTSSNNDFFKENLMSIYKIYADEQRSSILFFLI